MNDTTQQPPGGFDPAVFLGATTTEANTRRPPIPQGTVLRGTLGEPKFRQVEGKKESTFGQTFTFCRIPVEIDLTQNSAILAQIGQEKVTLNHEFGVDVAANGQGFDMAKGKNNGLRALREALGMNVQGQPFNIMMIVGRTVLCRIGNRPGAPGSDEVFDEVAGVAKLPA